MSALTLKVAVNLVNQAISAGRAISAAPLTIAVLDAGGHLITLQREDGASLLRPQIAIGKAWGAIALGKGSRLLALDAQQRPAFIAALEQPGAGQRRAGTGRCVDSGSGRERAGGGGDQRGSVGC